MICKDVDDYSPILPSVTCLTLSDKEGFHSGLVSKRGVSSVVEVLCQSRAALVGSIGISKVKNKSPFKQLIR